MKILVTGSNGLLGQKLVKLLCSSENTTVIATARNSNRLPENLGDYEFTTMDIADSQSVEETVANFKPDVIINTAAMTNVDQCEKEREACWQANVASTQYLVDSCEKHNVHLVHVSTDFIFDGTEGPLKEDAVPNPVNYYGESKLEGEKIVQNSKISWSIARTVLVFGIAHDMSRSNIILWVKKSLEDGKQINVVNDQWRTPTLAEDLAQGCALLAESKAEGIFNISGKDMLTPYDMAIATADFFQLDKSLIHETDGSKFTQPAKRPPKTGFVIDKAREILGYTPHSFVEGLAVLKSQLG